LYDVINRKGEIEYRVQFPKDYALAGFGDNGVVYVTHLNGRRGTLQRTTVKLARGRTATAWTDYNGPPGTAVLEELTMTGAGLLVFRKEARCKLRPARNALTAITRAANPAKNTFVSANDEATPKRPSEPGLTRLRSSSASRRKNPPAVTQDAVMSAPIKATSQIAARSSNSVPKT
jgi:hypothetical protein